MERETTTIEGGTGNDALTGNGGDDTIAGDTGTDTASFAGDFADYSISFLAGPPRISVVDNVPGTPATTAPTR